MFVFFYLQKKDHGLLYMCLIYIEYSEIASTMYSNKSGKAHQFVDK